MIKFFQKHKAIRNIIYATVVITFVGAGFVGWGGVKFKNPNEISKIGDEVILTKDVNREINSLALNKFKSYKGPDKSLKVREYISLNKQNLFNQAKNNLIYKYKKLNYYKNNLLLSYSNSEIFNILKQYDKFKINNKFNAEVYKKTISKFGFTPHEYEKIISNIILENKFNYFAKLGLYPKDYEKKPFIDILAIYSDIVVKVIPFNSKFNKIDISEEDLKKYWDSNKNKYIYDKSFNITYTKLDKDKNESFSDFKKRALKKAISIKKGKNKLTTEKTVYQGDFLFEKIKNPVIGKINKPFFVKNSAYIVRINKIFDNNIKKFSDAKTEVLIDLKNSKAKELILKSINYKNINNASNYIGKVSPLFPVPKKLIDKVKDINLAKSIYKILISKKNIKGNFIVNHYVVVYKIVDIGMSNDKVLRFSIDKIVNNLLYEYKIKDYLSHKINK